MFQKHPAHEFHQFCHLLFGQFLPDYSMLIWLAKQRQSHYFVLQVVVRHWHLLFH